MDVFQWRAFLTRWSENLIAGGQHIDHLPPEVIHSRWLGFPGATEEQIGATETRLGITLPLSYREFLKATNGWHGAPYYTTFEELWSTDDIDSGTASKRDRYLVRS